MILSGLLSQRYGQEFPLSLNASLTFEQSYDEIEGDSASAAELIALLSAISGIPVDQGKAITGSINQRGQVQAIGGVNEKIEGFFAVCRQKGLTGDQGVLIPAANRRSLMLKEEVVEAVKAGAFHIWTVQALEEAILLLTGREAGERQPGAAYPDGSFNQAVMARLRQYHQAMKALAQEERRPKKKSAEDAKSRV